MTNKLLLGAAGGLVVDLLAAVWLGATIERQHAPATSAVGGSPHAALPTPDLPVAPAPPASGLGGSDADLAMNSADPTFVGFISSFKASATASCKASLIKATQNLSGDFAVKAQSVCDCATNNVVATITVDEARSATESAVLGNATTNPAIQVLKTRFLEAGKACMLKANGK